MAGSKSAATEEPRISNIRVQTSIAGLTIPVVYGKTRITANLIYQSGFKATKQTERQETGKGGSPPSRTYYTYSANVIMALSDGPIYRVPRVWRGKQEYAETTPTTTTYGSSQEGTIPVGGVVALNLSPQETLVGIQQVTVSTRAGIQSGDDPFPPTRTSEVSAPDEYTLTGSTLTFTSNFVGSGYAVTYTVTNLTPAQSALESIGLGLKNGRPDQTPWSFLQAEYSSDALSYSGIAYIYGREYQLSNYAQVENHTFEVVANGGISEQIPDCDPALVIWDMLTNPVTGMGFASGWLYPLTQYSAYCRAAQMLISPAFTAQRPGREWIKDILEATNTDACWTGEQLKLLPRYEGGLVDPTLTFTFNPDITPVAEITIDDLIDSGTPYPVTVQRIDDEDVPNIYRAEYSNRTRSYDTDVVSVEDEASIVTTGARADMQKSWLFFCDQRYAQWALEQHKHFRRSVRNRYTFRLPFRFDMIEVGDLLTLTYAPLNLAQWPVRVERIVSDETSSSEITVRDFPAGATLAPVMQPQVGSGFSPDYNVDAGDLSSIYIFEPPGGFTSTGLEVWVAAASTSPTFGGCDIYASLDGGESYRLVSTIQQGSTMGELVSELQSGSGASFFVDMLDGSRLFSVSSYEADSRQTLCLVGAPTPDGIEFLGYERADLQAPGRYLVSNLRRGWYGTPDSPHLSRTPFVFLDDAIGTSGPLDTALIGSTIRFKILPFNVFGGGRRGLGTAKEYLYTVTGRFVDQGDRRTFYQNMLPNPAWTGGTTGWQVTVPTGWSGGVDASGSTALPGPALKALKFLQTSSTANAASAIVAPSMAVEEGKTYALALKVLTKYSTRAYLLAQFNDTSGVQIQGTVQEALFTDRAVLSSVGTVPSGRYAATSPEARRLWGPAVFFIDGVDTISLQHSGGVAPLAAIKFVASRGGNINAMSLVFNTLEGFVAGETKVRVSICDDDDSPSHRARLTNPRWENTYTLAESSAEAFIAGVSGAVAHIDPVLVEGTVYHLVVENAATDPATRYAGLIYGWAAASSNGPSEFVLPSDMSLRRGYFASGSYVWDEMSAAFADKRGTLPAFGIGVAGATDNIGVMQYRSGTLPADRHFTMTAAAPARELIASSLGRAIDGFSMYMATTTGGSIAWKIESTTDNTAFTLLDSGVIDQVEPNYRLGNEGEGIFRRYDVDLLGNGVEIVFGTVYYITFTPVAASEWKFAAVSTGADQLVTEWTFGYYRGEWLSPNGWRVTDPTNPLSSAFASKDFHLPLVFHEQKVGPDFYDPQRPSTYDDILLRATAPQGAVSVSYALVVHPALAGSGQNAEAYLLMPGLYDVPSSFEGIPTWNGGHRNVGLT